MFACLRFDIFSHSPMFTATFASCWTLEGRRLRTKHQRRFLVDASLMLRWLVAKLSKAFYQLDWWADFLNLSEMQSFLHAWTFMVLFFILVLNVSISKAYRPTASLEHCSMLRQRSGTRDFGCLYLPFLVSKLWTAVAKPTWFFGYTLHSMEHMSEILHINLSLQVFKSFYSRSCDLWSLHPSKSQILVVLPWAGLESRMGPLKAKVVALWFFFWYLVICPSRLSCSLAWQRSTCIASMSSISFFPVSVASPSDFRRDNATIHASRPRLRLGK